MTSIPLVAAADITVGIYVADRKYITTAARPAPVTWLSKWLCYAKRQRAAPPSACVRRRAAWGDASPASSRALQAGQLPGPHAIWGEAHARGCNEYTPVAHGAAAAAGASADVAAQWGCAMREIFQARMRRAARSRQVGLKIQMMKRPGNSA